MADRVMIFIDGSNLYHSLKNHFGRTDLDIGRFCRKLVERRQLVRIYYYNAKVGQKQEPELYKQQQAFFAGINAIPYTELRLGRLVYANWPNSRRSDRTRASWPMNGSTKCSMGTLRLPLFRPRPNRSRR
jgi:hypothetical protein